MSTELENKITTIESLYSEQEYTLHKLNDIVSRQDKELNRLHHEIRFLKQQYQSLRESLPEGESDNADEVPPHY